MNALLKEIKGLKNTGIFEKIKSRTKEFENTGKMSADLIFSELCFCILTANFNAERGINIQKAIGQGFLQLSKQDLRQRLKELGHRFPNARAGYIVEARKHLPKLKSLFSMDDKQAREYLIKNVKGLGYKEASHFLRNIGRKNLAIIDFHILDILEKNSLIKKSGMGMTRKYYLETEEILENLAYKSGLSLAELDLCLWYLETGKILK